MYIRSTGALKACLLAPLVDLLKNGTTQGAQENAARVVGYMALKRKNRDAIREEGAIEQLCKVCT